ncbi:dual specificity protein phosphatase Mpk3 isoform X1 [Tribolium madens]|uniref:dual specificity protein phosphatase Mpk3 isoform X1 n=1 Tax=Tribolium madens TaxID=41895 RepID=UPI001CF723DF|nr:dual specificity protein phosphatase Mpk3 isoform X1 [Tribolium madens]
MPTTPECDYDIVSNEGLLSLLRNESKKIVILDCRSSIEYGECHIRDAVNFSIPSIMLRRLAAGKIDLASTVKCRELKHKICSTYKENLFVLYNDLSGVQQHQADSVLNVLLRRLTQDGCRVVCLKDEFQTFRNSYPEWCDSCSELLDTSGGTMPSAAGPDPLPLMGLRSLRISAPPLHRPHRSCDSLSSTANSSTDSSDTDDRCDSSLVLSGLEDDREFPVEILPYLFLGNAANSEDSQSLERHGIQYILNVTPDLPNVFENVGHYKYMQIPITDHWSQNLASHFPEAIEFIDEARSNQKGILVHCLAGVSRSVTITVAYLMYKCSLNLNDAFNVVRSHKSNIAPNFHFMEQLYNFERELKLNVSSQSPEALMEKEQKSRSKGEQTRQRGACQNCGLTENCKCRQHMDFLSPLAQIGVSPDSGIEFDRWASSTPNE